MPVAGGSVAELAVAAGGGRVQPLALPVEVPPPTAALARAGRRSCPAGAGLDDDVAELLRVGQPAQGVDGELELLALGDGLLADLAGGDLQVLLGDGRHHVGGRSPARPACRDRARPAGCSRAGRGR